MKKVFSFPHPVNEAAARSVALGVVVMSALALLTGWAWMLFPLTYGFLARVAAGPRFSPLGQFATRISGPRLVRWQKFVSGPPKRFSQGIGFALTLAATITWLKVGWSPARWFLVPLLIAASLEGFGGFCLGCTIFGWLMRWGIIPDSVCEECADLSKRYAAAGFSVSETTDT